MLRTWRPDMNPEILDQPSLLGLENPDGHLPPQHRWPAIREVPGPLPDPGLGLVPHNPRRKQIVDHELDCAAKVVVVRAQVAARSSRNVVLIRHGRNIPDRRDRESSRTFKVSEVQADA